MMSHNVLQSMQLLGDAAGSFTDNMGVGTQERRRGRLDAPAAAPPRRSGKPRVRSPTAGAPRATASAACGPPARPVSEAPSRPSLSRRRRPRRGGRQAIIPPQPSLRMTPGP
nr:hypothetical protein DWF04_19450 [Cereibacter sphaeroides f. sp. denitrificans]